MTILKYQYQGQKVLHDVHFRVNGKLCRYGSDEEAKPALKKAYSDLCQIAGEIAGIPVKVRRLQFFRKDNKVEIVMECSAATPKGLGMRILLPRVGWQSVHKATDDGGVEEQLIPDGIEDDGIVAIGDMEAALTDYVHTGSGQLDLAFEHSEELIEQAEGLLAQPGELKDDLSDPDIA